MGDSLPIENGMRIVVDVLTRQQPKVRSHYEQDNRSSNEKPLLSRRTIIEPFDCA
jgi:hypothetical protein